MNLTNVKKNIHTYFIKLTNIKKNVHPYERIARIIFGLILISFAFQGPTHFLFLLGIIPVITGLIGWCPLYALFGISTCNSNV